MRESPYDARFRSLFCRLGFGLLAVDEFGRVNLFLSPAAPASKVAHQFQPTTLSRDPIARHARPMQPARLRRH